MDSTGPLNWMMLSTTVLGAWWLCYRLALRNERGFVYNRGFLVLGPVLAAGLPLLPLAWPAGWGAASSLPGMASVLLPAVRVSAAGPASSAGLGWGFWVWTVYLGGALLTLGRLGVELSKLWLATRALAGEKCADYTLVPTHGQLPTSSFGRVVLWDETLPLSATEARQVLCHELAHVRQCHTHDRLLLELLRAALWFNPFVHLCGRALALTHEYLADEAALRDESAASFSATRSYAHLLARQVASRLGFSVPLAHSFSHSQTLRRIAMIQKTSPIRRWKQWLALPLVALCLFTVACEQRTEAVAPSIAESNALAQYEATVPPPPPVPVAPDVPPPPPEEGKVYTYVEQMPHLPGGGGTRAIMDYIQSHLAYPNAAAADRKTGRVFVSFIVLENGAVKGAKIIKGLATEYDGAVLDAVQKLPRFVPGAQAGKAVAVSFTVPVLFAPATLPDGQQANTIGR